MSKAKEKRRVCFVISSKIHYARSKLLLAALKKHPAINLQIVLAGSAILDQYGDVEPDLLSDGYSVDAKILTVLSGGTVAAMAKTAGLVLLEFPSVLERLKPDIVLLRGDRFEILPLAAAAAFMNKTVAHIEGGDISGTVDESVRHAVTKLAHVHFTTNEESKNRVLRMGENPRYVFNVGSTEIEFVEHNNWGGLKSTVNDFGVGDVINVEQPFIIVMQHSVTTEVESSMEQINNTLEAVHEVRIPTIWFWPNIDAGTDGISKGIRIFRENKHPEHIRFIRYIPAEHFLRLLQKSSCLVGNSSSGLKEAAFLGVPVVNIGSRQDGRYHPKNVLDVPYDRDEIKKAIISQVAKGNYKPDYYYYKKNTSNNIANILANMDLYRQKRFFEKHE